VEKGSLTLASVKGKASIILVICILVAAGFALLSYLLYRSNEVVREMLADEGKKTASLQQAYDEEVRKYNNLFSELLGYKDENAIMEEVAPLKGEKTLKNLISRMRAQQEEAQKQISDLNKQISDLKGQLDKAAAEKKAADEAHSKELADLRKQIDSLNSDIKARISEYEKKIAAAQSEAAVAKTKLTEREKTFAEEKAKLEARITALQKTIEAQKREIALLKKSPAGPSGPAPPRALIGQVISAQYGYASINLGKDSGVKQGMTFEVYQRKEDQWFVKAKVEVKNVYKDFSSGVVQEENSDNPVQAGDPVLQVVAGATVTPEEAFSGLPPSPE